MKCVDFLEEEGYILNFKGKAHADKSKRKISFMSPTDKFVELFGCNEFILQCEGAYQEAFRVVELRDESKNPVSYRSNQEVKEMEELVTTAKQDK